MLEELKVNNFLSLINVTFQPRDVNLLIGLNNSGKTNLCTALQFLSLTSRYELIECAKQLGIPIQLIRNRYFDKPVIEFSVLVTLPHREERLRFTYHLSLSVETSTERNPVPSVEVQSEDLKVQGDTFGENTLLENKGGSVKLLHERNKSVVETTAPQSTTMLQRLYDLDTNPRANLFRKYLGSWQYYEFSHTELRKSPYRPADSVLDPHGTNLASVIHSLKKSDERSYRMLLMNMKAVEKDLDFINFTGGDTEPNVFMYLSHSHGLDLPAWRASSGTLRFLAYVYVLLAQPILKQYRPLVVIEEPENGLYVGLLKGLFELVDGMTDSPQVIFTSHSPYLIDLFDSRLDSVVAVKKDEYQTTVVNIDAEKAKARLTDFPLGEQHFRGMLT